jgi:tetratricopeptide (TPR) repeat protein
MAQNLAETFELAEMQYAQRNFVFAEKTYKRVLYFDSENQYRGQSMEKLAHIALANGQLQEALNYFDQAYFSLKNPQQQINIQFTRVQIFIRLHAWQKALAELYQIDSADDEQRALLYEGYCQYQLKDFDAAQMVFSAMLNNANAQSSLDAFFQDARKIEKMNPKTYQVLSYFIPGLGQILLGDAKSSMNSTFLNTALALLFIDTANKLSLFDATLSVIPWFYRYYAGGAKLTKDLAITKKYKRHQENLAAIIDYLEQSKLSNISK